MNIGFLGGDRRMVYCAERLSQQGHTVYAYLPEVPLDSLFCKEKIGGNCIFTCPAYLCEKADAVVLPMPVTKDGKTLFQTDLPLSSLPFRPRQTILGGMLPADFYPDCRTEDYGKDEAFLRYNAFLTAQGILSYLLPLTEQGLFGVSVGVIGFGRIASCLCPMLMSVGASVTVYVRKKASLAEAVLRGFSARLTESTSVFPETVLINTAPHFSAEGKKASPTARYLDAAGGASLLSAGEKTLKAVPLPGIPGRFAPKAAGNLLAETVLSLGRL